MFRDSPRGTMLTYGSVCSGIEAASVAWHPLGWRPAFFSEIDAFPRAVLAERWPDVPLHGDFTTIQQGEYADIDVLVGGTPCQSFSVAGLRKGLDDERGNLALEFLRLAARLGPRWVVWENVPGVLSSSGGRDFGAFLGGLAELGYGWAYRVLDAQYVRVDGYARAVPQRRRRVFVVGHLGDWRRAAAVLFERESLSGHPAPRREAGKAAPTILSRSTAGGGLGTDFDCDGGLVAPVASTLNAHYGEKWGLEDQHINQGAPLFVAHSLRADGFDASEDGTGRGTPLVPIAIQERAVCENPDAGPQGAGFNADGSAYTLEARNKVQAVAFAHQGGGIQTTLGYDPDAGTAQTLGANQTPAIAFAQNQRDEVRTMSVAGALAAEPGAKQQTYAHIGVAVRRLTPRECERLQGFPDDYTAITRKGKPAADGPRYKALGNSMAVNCMRWIGRRIALVEEVIAAENRGAA